MLDRSFDHSRLTIVVAPGRTVLEGIVRAAALMARADGHADEQERRGLLRFLRSRGLLQGFGRLATTKAYQAELARDVSQADGLMHLESLRGQSPAALVIAVAESVAAADGVAHPAELDLLHQMRARLDPAGGSGSIQVA